jgi:hypothetical protein
MAPHQYAEGVRRGKDRCQRPSSVSDDAVWLQRVADLNFPTAAQTVDWRHAGERLLTVGQAVFGEGSAQWKEWVNHQLDRLWEGRVRSVESGINTVVHHRTRRLVRGRGRDIGQAMSAGPSELHSGHLDRAW